MEHGNEPKKQPARKRYRPHENTDFQGTHFQPGVTPENSTPQPSYGHSYTPPQDIDHPSSAQSLRYPSQYTSQMTVDSQKTDQTKPNDKSRSKTVFTAGIALCSIVLVVSAGMIFRYYSQIHHAKTASNQLRDLYHEQAAINSTEAPSQAPVAVKTEDISPAFSTNDEPFTTLAPDVLPSADAAPPADFLAQWPAHYPGNEQLRIQEQFTTLRRQNRDVVGWLSIEGVVDEPVFQRDNSFYLNHDATGAKNPTGALFLDENCNLRTVPMQTLIHGHNMKEGAMFGSLKKYKVKDASFYREHPFIQFDSLYESATYVIFSVAEVSTVSGNAHYFPFWHKFHFENYESFRQYVSLAKEYSRFKVDIDVQPGDRLLTLATCSSGDDDLRLIIMARMLRENEDTILLMNQIYSATAK